MKMSCPQCQSEEISASGVCPVCGYVESADAATSVAASQPALDPKESQTYSGAIEIDYSEGDQDQTEKEEQPQWRRDLAQRLQDIKKKKEAAYQSKRSQSRDKDMSLAAQLAKASKSQAIAQATFIEGAPAYKPVQKPRGPVPQQKTLKPLAPELSSHRSTAPPSDPADVRTLIDSAVSRKNSQPGWASSPIGLYDSAPEMTSDYEGKLILLSRTLSGLVDLIIVVICSGVCILAADFCSGIIELDVLSYISFAVLFLLTYFLYSLFFLTAAGQTIGMMITELRVVGIDNARPLFGQLLRRCSGHLVSVLGLGFGLLWSLFDRESMCFHDRISGTSVIRA
jgi:uncharacterized RDD family membrane protein YckC